MHTLSFEESEDNLLTFELFVDDTPLGDLVGGASGGIPFHIVTDDLPGFGAGEGEKQNVRIVCVCSCGEYGCGNTRCIVTKEKDIVVFSDFTTDAKPTDRTKRFCFSRKNYDEVIVAMVAAANAQRKKEY